MIVLFEEYHYKTEFLANYLSEKYFFAVDSQKSKINYVGYYFSSKSNNGLGETVIILPKVFFNENQKVFNDFTPEEIYDCSNIAITPFKGIGNTLFEISTWFFRAIQQFKKRNNLTTITDSSSVNEVISNFDNTSASELDIVLSLFKFFRENQTLFTFISKKSNSQLHKINWNKTVNKHQPLISNNQPIYLNVNSKRRKINDEEELLVLFYSTLNYLKSKYSFELVIPEQYKLITGHEFEKYLFKGTRFLKNIKYKYFSDKLISLYNLLYVFFDRSNKIKANHKIEEVLLVKDFNIVFEDMIDDLIGDPNLVPELKNHSDGKQVDHIYKYDSLILKDTIYYVGDSKYYKNTTSIGQYSQAKQFTYAKNIIQHSINLFNTNSLSNDIQYRDFLTEGYNITPNFFITAFVDSTFDFKKSYLKDNGETKIQFHFENRLFDRDTLLVQSYNINFLFVVSAYISKNNTSKEKFKKDTKTHFREKLLNYINTNYKLFILEPIIPSDEFVTKYFKLLNGKMYRPSHFKEDILLAFENKKEYQSILDIINVDCKVLNSHTLI